MIIRFLNFRMGGWTHDLLSNETMELYYQLFKKFNLIKFEFNTIFLFLEIVIILKMIHKIINKCKGGFIK